MVFLISIINKIINEKNIFLLLLMGCIVLQAQEKMTTESATEWNHRYQNS